MKYMLGVFWKLLPCIPLTLALMALSFTLGLICAAGIAFLKLRGNLPLRLLAGAFITVIRCTPPVILFFLVFFGLPIALSSFGVTVKSTDSNLFAVIAMTLMASGSMAEMLRAAFLAVDRGQYEAAPVLPARLRLWGAGRLPSGRSRHFPPVTRRRRSPRWRASLRPSR